MRMLLVKVNGRPGAVVGYAPSAQGAPRAIVVIDGAFTDVALGELQLAKEPKGLRKLQKILDNPDEEYGNEYDEFENDEDLNSLADAFGED